MEDTLNLKTSSNGICFETNIDNSKNFKYFYIKVETFETTKTLDIQIDSKRKVLYINGVKFNGITLELLKSFLNQLP